MRVCVLEQQVKQPYPGRSPDQVLDDTLKLYEESAKYAHEQKCGLLVGPELGIYNGLSADQMLLLSEQLPPLGDEPNEAQQPVLFALAKIARENNLYLVCSIVERDDAFYNTTTVLDVQGRLVARHRKIHLYLEPGLTPSHEKPVKVQIPGLGQVELITCFDIFFVEANQDSPSDFAILVSHWFDETPSLTVLSMSRAWSICNRTPIIVCNSRFLRQGTLGAGLLFPDGRGQYSMSFSKEREAIHVFDLQMKPPALIRDPQDVVTPDSVYQPILPDLTRYKRIALTHASGAEQIDLPTVSCQITYELEYQTDNTMYIMLAADGVRRFGNGDRLYLQEVYAIAVDAKTQKLTLRSGPRFRSLRISLTIKDDIPSRSVFPTIVGNNLSLVDATSWQFNRDQTELVLEDIDVVCAGMFRRVFSKDIVVTSRQRSQSL